jgi:small-conductance mechanosensitive channel/predicted  nucleic acid-binding Zn-ribbon protein
MSRFIPSFLIALMLVSLPGPLRAQEQASSPDEEKTQRTEYPGFDQVVPRSSLLLSEASQARRRIEDLRDPAVLRERLETVRQHLQSLEARVGEVVGPLGQGFGQLLDLRESLTEASQSLEILLDDLSSRIAEIASLGSSWRSKKTFWEEWRDSLAKLDIAIPQEEFEQARETIEGVLEQVSAASTPLVRQQKEVTDLKSRVNHLLAQIEEIVRRQSFKKVSHSFASREFLQQFNAALWVRVLEGIGNVQRIGYDFVRSQGWIIALQTILVFVLGGFIFHHRAKVEDTEEWHFILFHPWATGAFVSLCSLSFLYSDASPLWDLLLWIVAASSAAILVCALLEDSGKRFMVWLLATLFLLSLILRAIAFPVPLYRLYLALLSLFGAPLFWVLAANNQRKHEGQLTGFAVALRLGAVILLVAFLAQFGGYSTISFRLIDSSLKTVFLGLFAAMTVKLGQGGIEFIFEQEFFRRWRFFRRFGSELTARLKTVFIALVAVYAGLYLLEIWNIYDSVTEGWSALLEYGFTIEEVRITVQRILVVGLVLYASIFTSWGIRSLLEAEVFPRRRFDRGIRDAIKKLLHYALIFVGFLFAMSLAGVELKNFAVLAGAFGIGIGFGLQNIVNNFVSGIILLFERPIRVGDIVIIDNAWGTVLRIGLRSTVVTTLEESEIIVPNSLLVSEMVTNWSLTSPLCRVSVPVGVAYGSDVSLVLKILVEAGEENPNVLNDPAPSPLFSGFGDSSLDFELRVWISNVRDRLRVRSEICQFIDRRFREEGVEIPFPQRDLHLRSVSREIGFTEERPQSGEGDNGKV